MQVSIIAIGDELLIGQVVDTNSGMISREINPDGWSVRSVRVVADDADEIKRAIKQAFDETDVVLTTGGLGPTKDDITKPTLCELFGGELVYDKAVEANVLEVPSSCRVIQNRVGTAPLMWFEKDGKVLVSMPGVPFETQEMFCTEVFPMLKHRFPRKDALQHRTFIVIGYSESVLAGMLDDYEKAMPGNVHLAYLPKPGLIRLRLTGTDTDASRHGGAKRQARVDTRQIADMQRRQDHGADTWRHAARQRLYDGDGRKLYGRQYSARDNAGGRQLRLLQRFGCQLCQRG